MEKGTTRSGQKKDVVFYVEMLFETKYSLDF